MAAAKRATGTRVRRRRAVAEPIPVRWDMRWMLAGIAVYAGVALSGIAIASVSHDIRSLVIALERMQRAEDEMLAEQSRLLLERSTLSSYQNVDQVAEEQLSMRFPERIEKVRR